MGTTTSTGTLFKPELVTDMFSKVKGHSTLAKLCGAYLLCVEHFTQRTQCLFFKLHYSLILSARYQSTIFGTI